MPWDLTIFGYLVLGMAAMVALMANQTQGKSNRGKSNRDSRPLRGHQDRSSCGGETWIKRKMNALGSLAAGKPARKKKEKR